MKKVATFTSFFVNTRTLLEKQKWKGCPPFLLISNEHSVKQSKESMLQNNIYT